VQQVQILVQKKKLLSAIQRPRLFLLETYSCL
jgi:hypothetical protein